MATFEDFFGGENLNVPHLGMKILQNLDYHSIVTLKRTSKRLCDFIITNKVDKKKLEDLCVKWQQPSETKNFLSEDSRHYNDKVKLIGNSIMFRYSLRGEE